VPAERTPQSRLPSAASHRLLAHQRDVGGREPDGGRDRQHVGLPAALEEYPQLRAAAVDFIPADEAEREPVGVGIAQDVDGQLALGPEQQVQGQLGDPGFHRLADVPGGDSLVCPGQRVPSLFPHVSQVHRVQPVRDPARAAHVLPLYPGRRPALLGPARIVQRADRHPPAPRPARRRV
jgi:hypothetical protein